MDPQEESRFIERLFAREFEIPPDLSFEELSKEGTLVLGACRAILRGRNVKVRPSSA